MLIFARHFNLHPASEISTRGGFIAVKRYKSTVQTHVQCRSSGGLSPGSCSDLGSVHTKLIEFFHKLDEIDNNTNIGIRGFIVPENQKIQLQNVTPSHSLGRARNSDALLAMIANLNVKSSKRALFTVLFCS